MKHLLSLPTALMAISLAFATPALAEHHGDGDHAKGKQRAERALQELPAEKAALVRTMLEEMRADKEAKRADRKAKHAAHHQKMQEMLTAENFNKSAFIAEITNHTKEMEAYKLKNAERIANLAGQLTQEERKVLAKILPQRGMKKGKGMKRHDGDKPRKRPSKDEQAE